MVKEFINLENGQGNCMPVHFVKLSRYKESEGLCGKVYATLPLKDYSNRLKMDPNYMTTSVGRATCRACLEKLLIIKNDECARLAEKIRDIIDQ